MFPKIWVFWWPMVNNMLPSYGAAPKTHPKDGDRGYEDETLYSSL